MLGELDSCPLPQDPEPLPATDDTAMEQFTWSIGLEGRAWSGSEAMQRHDLLPAQLEMVHALDGVGGVDDSAHFGREGE